MKQIYYQHGPATITAGAAGMFERGKPKKIDDKLADALLARKDIVFSEGTPKKTTKEVITNG